jgi:hypothetical protein
MIAIQVHVDGRIARRHLDAARRRDGDCGLAEAT